MPNGQPFTHHAKKITHSNTQVIEIMVQYALKGQDSAGEVAQVVECLPSKCEALSSNPIQISQVQLFRNLRTQ
jgi:hypothetical protein